MTTTPTPTPTAQPRNHSETWQSYYDAYLNDVEFQNLYTMLTHNTSPEQVEGVATELRSQQGTVSEFATNLKTDRDTLMESWKGEDADEFKKKIDATLEYAEESAIDMSVHAPQLEAMAEALRTAKDGAPDPDSWWDDITDSWWKVALTIVSPFASWLLHETTQTWQHQQLAERMATLSTAYDDETSSSPYVTKPGDDMPGGPLDPENPDLGTGPTPTSPGGPPPTGTPEMPDTQIPEPTTPDTTVPDYDPDSPYDPTVPSPDTPDTPGNSSGLQSGGGLGSGAGLGSGGGLGSAGGLGSGGGTGAGTGLGSGMGGMMGGAGGRGGGRGGGRMGGGMMGGGGGRGGAGNGGEGDHNTWLQEDEDVWGGEADDLPPGVVR